MKKNVFSLILVVVALLTVNATAVSADSSPTVKASVTGGLIVPLTHGIDH